MAPTPAATAAAKARAAPQTATAPRATRSRAAKDTTSTPVGAGKPAGLLARGKEGLRKVSDKIKEKEKEKEKEKTEGRKRTATIIPDAESTESLKAFLRIRPPPEVANEIRQRPYLEIQNDREVLMRAPMDPTRPTIPKAPLIFSFDRVFPPSSPQSTFFSQTTLPLVDKLLHGENGLLFAYGVTNSGKSYTISGGQGATVEEKGVLPRAVDVVFNSIEGMESRANVSSGPALRRVGADIKIRTVGTGDIEFLNEPEPNLHSLHLPQSTSEQIKVDRNYSYAVFISYAEVYNDKNLTQSSRRPSGLPRASSQAQSSMNLAAIANGGAGVLKRRVLQLKPDPEGNGKYISGLNEIRVRTRGEAMSIFHSGESARQVFSTLSNRESSRSHGIFTIKVVRVHNGAPNDPDSAQVSRLAIVDLAGSERNKNTGTSGDRLKEAGNINKSLMVLGQCLETLRANQQKSAQGGKKLAMVPFRHAKLTEIFQNFFVGDGRAVMIVNVNPYDTGFDENSHVMRFSAVAREVQTTAQNKVSFPGLGFKRQISSQFSAFKHAVSGGSSTPMKVRVSVPILAPQKAVAGRESEGFVMVEEELEVVEEPDSETEEEEDETDVLVDSLFDQLREMKTRVSPPWDWADGELYEAELHNATMEAEIRDEMTNIHQEVMAKMQADHMRRIQELYEANEIRADKKIDIVTRMTPGPARRYRDVTPMSSEGDTSMGDETFSSALDGSPAVATTSSIRQPRMSDPFIVRTGAERKGVPGLTLTRSSDQRDSNLVEDELALDEGEGNEAETELDVSTEDLGRQIADQASCYDLRCGSQLIIQKSPVQTALPARPATSALISSDPIRSKRAETAESDDILAAPFDPNASTGTALDDDSELSEEEGSNEEEEEEEEEIEEGEPDLDTGDQADQDSSFASSIDIHAVDEDDDTASSFEVPSSDDEEEEEEVRPVRRASRARRTTGSPRKRSPVKKSVAGTPAKSAAKKGPASKAKAGSVVTPSRDLTSPTRVLGERVGQDLTAESGEEEEEEEIVVAKPKKKRTLGKKVVMEDDMVNSPVAGAEVRRMARG